MAEPRFSIAFQTDKALSAYGPLAARVEALGFDGVAAYNDMLYQPAWPALLAMARQTKRITLGPAAVNPFTSHPVQIAGQISLLAEASGGRAYLGLARGAWLDFVGLKPDRPVTALAEAFAAIRHLLRRDPAPLPGSIFPLAGGDSLRWPGAGDADIPFMLGSWGPQTIAACRDRVAAVKLGGTANPGAVRWLRGLLGDSGVAVVVGTVTVVDTDRAAARARARREVALYLPVIADLDPSLSVDPERLARIRDAAARFDYEAAAAAISDDLLDRFALAGTPVDVVEQCAALVAAGVDRVEFGTPHGLTPESGLSLLGEAVLPALRRL